MIKPCKVECLQYMSRPQELMDHGSTPPNYDEKINKNKEEGLFVYYYFSLVRLGYIMKYIAR